MTSVQTCGSAQLFGHLDMSVIYEESGPLSFIVDMSVISGDFLIPFQ
jgi:hypothetical protein